MRSNKYEREVLENNFTIITNNLLQDRNLTAGQVAVIVRIFSWPPDWEWSAKWMGGYYPESEKWHRKIFQELIILGYITRHPRQCTNGAMGGWTYRAYQTRKKVTIEILRIAGIKDCERKYKEVYEEHKILTEWSPTECPKTDRSVRGHSPKKDNIVNKINNFNSSLVNSVNTTRTHARAREEGDLLENSSSAQNHESFRAMKQSEEPKILPHSSPLVYDAELIETSDSVQSNFNKGQIAPARSTNEEPNIAKASNGRSYELPVSDPDFTPPLTGPENFEFQTKLRAYLQRFRENKKMAPNGLVGSFNKAYKIGQLDPQHWEWIRMWRSGELDAAMKAPMAYRQGKQHFSQPQIDWESVLSDPSSAANSSSPPA